MIEDVPQNPSEVIVKFDTEIKQAARKWWRNSSNSGKFSEEDLQQEAALAAVRACKLYDKDKGSLGGYIYSSASREVMKFVQENTYDLNVSRKTQETEKIHHGWALSVDLQLPGNGQIEKGFTLGDLIPASGELPLDKLQRDEEKEALQKGMSVLNPIEYDIIRRHKLEGQAIKDIAKELGMTTNNLYSIESRGLKKLKTRLEELMGVDSD